MTYFKKSLGQHWLYDKAVLQRMVSAGEITENDTVLEVGPGQGTLTEYVCEAACEVIAVEADEELAGQLPDRITSDNLSVVTGDILTYDFTRLPEGYKMVGNIPYYLTSRLLRVVYDGNNPPVVASLLVQKEVAERVAALPGDMSLLAVSVQYFADPVMLDVVPKELFTPVPQVDSAILQIRLRPQPYFSANTETFFRLVKAGFSERRKKLANALSGGLRIDKQQAIDVLQESGIGTEVRAQELSLDQWQVLYTTALQHGIVQE